MLCAGRLPNLVVLHHDLDTLEELQQTILQPGELLFVYGVMQETTCLWLSGLFSREACQSFGRGHTLHARRETA